MEKEKKIKNNFPKGFFTKIRPEAIPSSNPDDEIIPIRWSKDVLDGKKKAVVKKLVQFK